MKAGGSRLWRSRRGRECERRGAAGDDCTQVGKALWLVSVEVSCGLNPVNGVLRVGGFGTGWCYSTSVSPTATRAAWQQ